MPKVAKALKMQNMAFLLSLAAFDSALLFAIVSAGPEGPFPLDLSRGSALRGALAAAAPFIVLVLTAIVPSGPKASLIFWRVKDVLPGHRAFSIHAVEDPRIDVAALKKNVGQFPSEAREQNTFWYKLFKKVEYDVAVGLAHRHYLLFRDAAALSIVLLAVVPIGLWIENISGMTAASILFAIQYAATATAARFQGIRFVKTVLATHSVKRRTS